MTQSAIIYSARFFGDDNGRALAGALVRDGLCAHRMPQRPTRLRLLVVMASGTASLRQIVLSQQGTVLDWWIFKLPVAGLAAFLLFLISSTAGIRGVVTNIAYQVAKGALPQFARALAREFANDNIRVNCVAPGVVRTAFHATMTEEQRRLNLEHRIPMHREGTPAQVAELILTLVKNDYITGETMTIDGGLTMRIA